MHTITSSHLKATGNKIKSHLSHKYKHETKSDSIKWAFSDHEYSNNHLTKVYTPSTHRGELHPRRAKLLDSDEISSSPSISDKTLSMESTYNRSESFEIDVPYGEVYSSATEQSLFEEEHPMLHHQVARTEKNGDKERIAASLSCLKTSYDRDSFDTPAPPKADHKLVYRSRRSPQIDDRPRSSSGCTSLASNHHPFQDCPPMTSESQLPKHSDIDFEIEDTFELDKKSLSPYTSSDPLPSLGSYVDDSRDDCDDYKEKQFRMDPGVLSQALERRSPSPVPSSGAPAPPPPPPPSSPPPSSNRPSVDGDEGSEDYKEKQFRMDPGVLSQALERRSPSPVPSSGAPAPPPPPPPPSPPPSSNRPSVDEDDGSDDYKEKQFRMDPGVLSQALERRSPSPVPSSGAPAPPPPPPPSSPPPSSNRPSVDEDEGSDDYKEKQFRMDPGVLSQALERRSPSPVPSSGAPAPPPPPPPSSPPPSSNRPSVDEDDGSEDYKEKQFRMDPGVLSQALERRSPSPVPSSGAPAPPPPPPPSSPPPSSNRPSVDEDEGSEDYKEKQFRMDPGVLSQALERRSPSPVPSYGAPALAPPPPPSLPPPPPPPLSVSSRPSVDDDESFDDYKEKQFHMDPGVLSQALERRSPSPVPSSGAPPPPPPPPPLSRPLSQRNKSPCDDSGDDCDDHKEKQFRMDPGVLSQALERRSPSPVPSSGAPAPPPPPPPSSPPPSRNRPSVDEDEGSDDYKEKQFRMDPGVLSQALERRSPSPVPSSGAPPLAPPPPPSLPPPPPPSSFVSSRPSVDDDESFDDYKEKQFHMDHGVLSQALERRSPSPVPSSGAPPPPPPPYRSTSAFSN